MSTSPARSRPVPSRRRAAQRGLAWLPLLAVLGLAAAAGSWFWLADEGPAFDGPLRPASRGPLVISVSEAGTIEARQKVVLKCEVDERSTTITYLIDEGTRVEEGDLLVELDASVLQDELYDEEIDVLDTEADYLAAKENLEVVRNQALADVSQAELTLRFAREDIKKYSDGEYPKLLLEATTRVTLAEERLTQAKDTLEWSERLAEKGFIATTELERDRLAHQSAELDVQLARAEVDFLEQYTEPRQLAQLESDVAQAELALDRVRRSSAADVAQAETALEVNYKQLQRQQAQLADIESQVERCRITAPVAGMVVYATTGQGNWRGNEEPLEVGREVRRQEELIHIPVAEAKSARVKIHESALDKVQLGMPVSITVDALPERRFEGTVAKLSPLPDAQSQWLNPDLKVFDTEIHLTGDLTGLRTGMTCRAEVLVARYEDAVNVPVHSVVRIDGQPTVFVLEEGRLVRRSVEVGLDNNRMIHIRSGLEEGELVSLAPPLEDTDAPAAGPEEPLDPEALLGGPGAEGGPGGPGAGGSREPSDP